MGGKRKFPNGLNWGRSRPTGTTACILYESAMDEDIVN